VDVVVGLLLAIGVGAELVCCVGVASAPTTLARVHYAAAGSTVGPLIVATAVAVEKGANADTATAFLVAALLFVLGTAASNAIAETVHSTRRR
jgi:multisubunit Na+/H+ antiporter MnhG subunit